MRCHEVTEIYPGIFLSGVYDVEKMIDKGVDVLVALTKMPDIDFEGTVIECRIRDMGVLPEEELDVLLEQILYGLEQGKRTGIFCSGGHGRTGYVAACLLAGLGIENPIEYLHKNYCINAMESGEQYAAVNRYVKRGYKRK